jgi:ABC-type uncharacterized transport system permease subunit
MDRMTDAIRPEPTAQRGDIARYIGLYPAFYPVFGVLLAFLVGALLIAFAGVSPVRAYAALVLGAFGSRNGIAETLVKTAPLLLVSLGVSIAYRAKLTNIGGEGQIYLGAIGATAVGLFLGRTSPVLSVALALAAGFLLGGLWAAIAAVTKIRFRASEIIVTLMLNYIAIQITSYLLSGPWQDPTSTEPYTAELASGVRLPIILPGTRLHLGIIVAVAATVVIWLVFKYTVYGYRIMVMGANIKAAAYSGLHTNLLLFLTMFLSGGLAGLAGVNEITGIHHRMIMDLSPGYGYTALAIAMLGRGRPLSVMVTSVLFAALVVGADAMQQSTGVPVSVQLVIEGLVLLFVLAGEWLRRRQVSAQQKRESKA